MVLGVRRVLPWPYCHPSEVDLQTPVYQSVPLFIVHPLLLIPIRSSSFLRRSNENCPFEVRKIGGWTFDREQI